MRHSFLLLLGWEVGFEPTTFGSTIRHSNQLSYAHHFDLKSAAKLLTFSDITKLISKKNVSLPYDIKEQIKGTCCI